MLSDNIAVQRTRWNLAAIKVELKLFRLQLIVKAYNPGQPRVPAGRPDGGQWTDEDRPVGLGADDDAHLILVGNEDDQRYKVDLMAEQARGGHTVSRHVGKTDDELLERIRKSQWSTPLAHGGLKRNGSFSSIDSANDLVNQTIQANKSIVDLVASGTIKDAFITKEFRYKTGREAYSTNDGVLYLRNTTGVGALIIHEPTLSRGFRVRTAHPQTEGD